MELSKLANCAAIATVTCAVFGCAAVLGIDDTSEVMPDATVVRDAPSTTDAAGTRDAVGTPDAAGTPDAVSTPDAAVSPDAQTSFVIRGTAHGLLEPIGIRLEYGGSSELLSIVADGPFPFRSN